MIDIHTHILPGLDDGSRDMEESLAMAELAVSQGTGILVATPHSNQPGRFENYESAGECKRVFDLFAQELKRAGIPLKILRGTEIYACGNLSRLIQQHEIVSLNHTGYYLVEFPFDVHPDEITRRLEEIAASGGRPIIAHPERYFCVQDMPNLVYQWMTRGALSQANKGSLLGNFGMKEERVSHVLLEHELISCIASDSHGSDWRTPGMAEIREYLARRYDLQVADYLLRFAPERILAGKGFSNRTIRPVSGRI